MPDHDDESDEDVCELMAAKDKATSDSWSTVSSTASASTVTSLLASLGFLHDDLDAKFKQAIHFVAVVQSRMRQDPDSIDLRLWELDVHRNRLWALRQQAIVGTCEASRGSKEYTVLDAQESAGRPNTISGWRPCCLQMTSDSKLKLWQDLGDMPKDEAQARYIRMVTEVAPGWTSPLSTDSALLRTWTPDTESDRCTVCDEAFTFLNRRHHCRRCSNLVCAVCSPHFVPLRVFSHAPDKPQRVCSICFHEIDQHRLTSGNSLRQSGDPFIRTDPKAHAPPAPPPFAFPLEDGDADADADPVSGQEPHVQRALPPSLLQTTARTAPKHSLMSASAMIQCGTLEFLHSVGFRKNWESYFFVLLIRKGSLGMFLTETDHLEKKKRPSAVFKLSGYSVRIKSQKRRPHQWRLSHATKKPLHFAATSIEEMNLWISQLIKAIDSANELEAQAEDAPRRHATATAVAFAEDETVV